MIEKGEDNPKGELAIHYRSKVITEIGRKLRRRSTKSENVLWGALKGKQLAGLKFRRQHPFGSSIVDFYCHEKRLVVEIDGAIHAGDDAKDQDRIRQEIIELYDVQFLRFPVNEIQNESVLKNIKAVADDFHKRWKSLSFRRGNSHRREGRGRCPQFQPLTGFIRAIAGQHKPL